MDIKSIIREIDIEIGKLNKAKSTIVRLYPQQSTVTKPKRKRNLTPEQRAENSRRMTEQNNKRWAAYRAQKQGMGMLIANVPESHNVN